MDAWLWLPSAWSRIRPIAAYDNVVKQTFNFEGKQPATSGATGFLRMEVHEEIRHQPTPNLLFPNLDPWVARLPES